MSEPFDAETRKRQDELKRHAFHDVQAGWSVLDRLLVVACALTLLATTYLTLSVLVLRPPRLNYGLWTLTAVLFVVHSMLTLAGVTGVWRSKLLNRVLTGGSTALVATGAWAVWSMLTGEHFEGYALILGAWVVLQGGLTLARLRPGGDDHEVIARPA